MSEASTHHTISVCIPTYNRPDLLEQAIRSCLSQTLRPHEIVVGDDSTSEATQNLIADLQAGSSVPLLYRRNTPRLGQNSNINSLFLRSASSHLVLLHDDDLLTPNALQDLISCWQTHPGLAAAFGKQYLMAHDGTVDHLASERLNQRYRRTTATAGLQPHGWEVGLSQQFPNNGYMIRTEAAREILWRSHEEIGFGGEFDFGLRLGLRYPHFFFLDTYTSMYRLTHTGSISRSRADDAALRSYLLVEAMDLPPEAAQARNEKLRRTAQHAMKQALLHGKKKEAWQIYRSPNHPWKVRLSPGGIRRLLLLLKP